jgi:hypothetical protein
MPLALVRQVTVANALSRLDLLFVGNLRTFGLESVAWHAILPFDRNGSLRHI